MNRIWGSMFSKINDFTIYMKMYLYIILTWPTSFCIKSWTDWSIDPIVLLNLSWLIFLSNSFRFAFTSISWFICSLSAFVLWRWSTWLYKASRCNCFLFCSSRSSFMAVACFSISFLNSKRLALMLWNSSLSKTLKEDLRRLENVLRAST